MYVDEDWGRSTEGTSWWDCHIGDVKSFGLCHEDAPDMEELKWRIGGTG